MVSFGLFRGSLRFVAQILLGFESQNVIFSTTKRGYNVVDSVVLVDILLVISDGS
jgi:hypothetical protein